MTDFADAFGSKGKPSEADTLWRRIEKLERRVHELEARQFYLPAPPPVYPYPQWWQNPPVITCVAGTAKPADDGEYQVWS